MRRCCATWWPPRWSDDTGARLASASPTRSRSRLVGTCWIAGLIVEAAWRGLSTQERLLILALASVCLVLDGVDGRLARARGEVSDFGARFDMETDALLLLWLSLAVPILGVAGWWAVAIAGLRYAYLVASWLIPALRVRLTEGVRRRKAVGVIGLVSPVLALAVDLVRPGWAPALILTIGLVCLVWSFSIDIGWQLRHHRTGKLAVRPPW